jgi:hypothetical protein
MPLDTPQAAVLWQRVWSSLGSLHRESFSLLLERIETFTTRVHLWWQATATTPLSRVQSARDASGMAGLCTTGLA